MILLEANPDEIATIGGVVEAIAKNFHIPRIAVALILAFLIFIVAKVVIAIVRRSLKDFSSRSNKFTPMMASLVGKIIAVVIWIIAIVAIVGVFGIDLTPVLAGLGITGVVLGFALQESISSFFSGIMIAINNPFRVGDWVDIGDISGTVVAMDLMCVTLASGDNKKITMNNKNVWGSTIINYSFIEKRRLDMKVSIRYSDDVEKAKSVLSEMLSSYPEVLSDPAPLVEIGSYDDSAITLYVRPWVKPEDYWKLYWRFNSELLPALRKNGIDMPFNQLDVHISKD
ncbi:MAG: mechanosensitive ion channel family protein [Spirochaetes bacterium]|uniref:Mechanosensitive ion channel family protein n=1 Tax=Candidatus Ornithospirochaeta stercoripullorum TaxID=2840899 RepID=A0A9D9H671_9SPIO|nr:mechanosensitive ion channel family protein [Candidatus Ornithospirochaeta stercoripullorum]